MSAARRGAAARGDRGQASVELALLLPVVALLLLAVLQVGLIARDVVMVSHAAREAARAAATDADPSAASRAAEGAGGLAPERTSVSTSPRGEPGTLITAEVSYLASTDVPLVGALLGDRKIRSTATMRVEGP